MSLTSSTVPGSGAIRTLASLLVVALASAILAYAPAARAASTTLFADDFEGGGLGAWTTVTATGGGVATVGSDLVASGAYAARLSSTSASLSVANARWRSGTPQIAMTVTAMVRIVAQGGTNGNVPLIRLFDSAGARVVSVQRQNGASNEIFVQHSGSYAKATGLLPLGAWKSVELTVAGADTGAASITVKLDGTTIYTTSSASLSAGIVTVQIGNEVKAQTFDLAVDDVAVSASEAPLPTPTPTPTSTADPTPTPTPGPSPTPTPGPSPTPTPGPSPTPTPTPTPTATPTATPAPTPSPIGTPTPGCSGSVPAPSNSDPGNVVLADNFERGLGGWTKISTQGDATVAIQQAKVKSGLCAVRQRVTSVTWDSRANLQKNLPAGTKEVWLTGWFNVERDSPDQGWNTPTFRVFTNGKRVLDVSRQNVTGNVFVRFPNGSGGWSYLMTGRKFDLNRWYLVKIHAVANGNLSRVEVWIDGVRYTNSSTVTLGVWNFDVAMLGAEHQNQEGDVVADDVVVKSVVPPPSNKIFDDDWESGTFGAWSSITVAGDGSIAAQQSVVKTGAWAGRLTATANSGSAAYVRANFLAAQTDVMVSANVDVTGEGAAGGNVPLIGLYDAGGVRRALVSRLNQNNDRLVVEVGGATFNVTGALPLRTWTNLRVRAVERGVNLDLLEVWLNEVLAFRTDTANLGTNGIKTLQIGNNSTGKAFELIVDDLVVEKGAAGLGNDPAHKLLIADYLNKRLLITDFDGRVIWKFDNPTQRNDYTAGPIGVRWLPGNRILATFGTGEVGVIDVATKTWVWKVWGFNGDNFQSPYDAELLPDGNLAVALRFNNGGRISVYDLDTGAEVWKHYLNNAHAVHFRTAAQSYNSADPTLLVGGWGNIREVAYRLNGGQNVTWQVKTEYTHDALVVENDRIITTEGYYIQKIDRAGTRFWKKMTPDEDRRVAIDPNTAGGYVFTVAESDRVEFRDVDGNLLRDWSMLSDGTGLDYPYGIQVIEYP